MITEITGDTNTFRAMAYGRPDLLTVDWCRQQEQQHLMMLDPVVRANYEAMAGTVFGAMVIGIISNGLNLIGVSSYWQLIIKGLIIACAVLLDCQKDKIALLKNKVRAAK